MVPSFIAPDAHLNKYWFFRDARGQNILKSKHLYKHCRNDKTRKYQK